MQCRLFSNLSTETINCTSRNLSLFSFFSVEQSRTVWMLQKWGDRKLTPRLEGTHVRPVIPVTLLAKERRSSKAWPRFTGTWMNCSISHISHPLGLTNGGKHYIFTRFMFYILYQHLPRGVQKAHLTEKLRNNP